jgi:hypothetical protein
MFWDSFALSHRTSDELTTGAEQEDDVKICEITHAITRSWGRTLNSRRYSVWPNEGKPNLSHSKSQPSYLLAELLWLSLSWYCLSVKSYLSFLYLDSPLISLSAHFCWPSCGCANIFSNLHRPISSIPLPPGDFHSEGSLVSGGSEVYRWQNPVSYA